MTSPLEAWTGNPRRAPRGAVATIPQSWPPPRPLAAPRMSPQGREHPESPKDTRRFPSSMTPTVGRRLEDADRERANCVEHLLYRCSLEPVGEGECRIDKCKAKHLGTHLAPGIQTSSRT
eukprot:scaffold38025_cov25-Tisochrysis_lutea.AAC.2